MRDVSTRSCRSDEVSIDNKSDNEKNFFAPLLFGDSKNEDGSDSFDIFFRSMRCFDEDIKLSGTGDSINESYLRILFEQCDESWYQGREGRCKSKVEVNEWVKDKHIVTL